MLPKLPTIEEAARLMRARELTPLDLVEHCLGRIAQFEDRIHAWVLVDEEGARKEAQRLTDMLARGEDLGPLHGIPIGIKDIINVAGWQTKCGSKLRENVPPAEKDASVVANLRTAGAIILGKTVTTEFACFDPPRTRNPWNLDHTPGGSSSGSAAAVAAEMCMAALGTQTGGSIIRPAAYCGVVGLKPDYQLMLTEGVFPFSRSLDHVGPFARNATDAEFVWREMLPHFHVNETPETPRPENVAIYFLDGGFLHEADGATQSHVTEVKRALATQFRVDLLPTPSYFSDIHALHRCIMAVEAADIHRESFEQAPGAYSDHIRTLIEEGRRTSALDYSRALRRQIELRGRLWRDIYTLGRGNGVLALPSTPTSAPASLDTTGNPIFNSPWSFLGVSTITLPSGLDAGGMPYGLQLVLFGINYLRQFDIARQCEAAIAFEARPPLIAEPNK